MLKEFKDFINRGSVMDLAVGVIIGAAFGKIVTSLVDDLISPIIGKVTGGIDLKDKFINLSDIPVDTLAQAAEKKVAVLAYGNFANNVISFFIISIVVFLLVKLYNRNRTPAEVATPPDVALLGEIRDLLAKERA